jgi:hypothetical protein
VRQHPAPGHDPLETMTQESYRHPITPPPELVQQWWEESNHRQYTGSEAEEYVVSMAAQWGADQELDACCGWLADEALCESNTHRKLRTARRSKPPSLKKQALMALEDGDTGPGASLTSNEVDIIRRALEQLPNNE